ncbi:extracellular solute-binding protein [Paenibacillus oceani]|uniref:Extracellular solute-binding protein n=1 Tax=Paenibacillus oceani TaxID=2772510 RepID=A0A927CHR7_9BACL|nr:extracellular solute-binding protein [Paenibacillus oceani]MBD2866436.1 extracellular solute-binding protein [Paenibacillus oceani]
MARPSRSQFTERLQQLTDRLRSDMAENILKPGDYLPSEVELGQTFQLSKESVRKALDTLVSEGYIVKVRRVGNRVVGVPAAVRGAEREQTPAGASAAAAGDGSMPAASRKEPAEVTAAASVVLRLAYYAPLEDEAKLSSMVASFEQENPGLRVHLMPTPFPHDYAEHGMADVFTVSAWDALKLKERDPELAIIGKAPDTEAAHPLLRAAFEDAEGNSKAAPFLFSPIVLCYNREHFRTNGLEEPCGDWTWYTLLKTARILARRSDIWGFAAHIQSLNRWLVFLLQNGFRFSADEGKRTSEDPALWESLRIARDLIHQQGRPQPLWAESDSDIERWFVEGKVSMIMTTYFGLNRLIGTELDYGVAPLPSLRTSDTLLLVTGLAVSSGARQPAEAQKLVRFLCGERSQLQIRRRTLSLPAHPAALALHAGLEGNRPGREEESGSMWSRCKLYGDLRLGVGVLEAIREELKSYWSRLEDEVEASERLDSLLR